MFEKKINTTLADLSKYEAAEKLKARETAKLAISRYKLCFYPYNTYNKRIHVLKRRALCFTKISQTFPLEMQRFGQSLRGT